MSVAVNRSFVWSEDIACNSTETWRFCSQIIKMSWKETRSWTFGCFHSCSLNPETRPTTPQHSIHKNLVGLRVASFPPLQIQFGLVNGFNCTTMTNVSTPSSGDNMTAQWKYFLLFLWFISSAFNCNAGVGTMPQVAQATNAKVTDPSWLTKAYYWSSRLSLHIFWCLPV